MCTLSGQREPPPQLLRHRMLTRAQQQRLLGLLEQSGRQRMWRRLRRRQRLRQRWQRWQQVMPTVPLLF